MVRSRTWLLTSVLFGLFAANFTVTIFNVALVDIAGNLHTTSGTLTWAITGPLLVIGVTAPILGKLGDVYGHRRLYLSGIVGSLVCAALTIGAWNAGSLIVARLFSGLGGASLSAASWALLFRVFAPGERTKVLGWWSLVGAGSPVLGVALGGPIVQAFGWRWIFVVQVPLLGVALAVNIRLLPETEHQPETGLDVPGALTLAAGMGALLLAVNQSSSGWTRPLVVGALAVAAVSLSSFVMFERRTDSPVFPLEWLSQRSFALPCLAAFALNFAYMGGYFLTPLFLEQGLRYGIGAAGFYQIARPLVFAIAAPAAGYLAVRTGERWAAVLGTVIMIASMLVFAGLRQGSAPIVIILALGASGMANGVAAPTLSAIVANSVDVGRMGSASGGMQVASQMGVVTGIQVMESIQVSRQHVAGLVGSYQDAYLVGAAVALLAVCSALLIQPVRPHRRTGLLVTAMD